MSYTKIKNFIMFLSISFGNAATFILTMTWFAAFFNNGEILVTINTFNEMWIEFVMFIIIVPIQYIGSYYLFKKL